MHTSNNSWIDSELEKLDEIQTAVSYDFSGKWNEEERRNAVCPHIDYAFLSCGGLEPDQAVSYTHLPIRLRHPAILTITRMNLRTPRTTPSSIRMATWRA